MEDPLDIMKDPLDIMEDPDIVEPSGDPIVEPRHEVRHDASTWRTPTSWRTSPSSPWRAFLTLAQPLTSGRPSEAGLLVGGIGLGLGRGWGKGLGLSWG